MKNVNEKRVCRVGVSHEESICSRPREWMRCGTKMFLYRGDFNSASDQISGQISW